MLGKILSRVQQCWATLGPVKGGESRARGRRAREVAIEFHEDLHALQADQALVNEAGKFEGKL